MKLKIVIEKGEDGYYTAHCPSLKGCWSQGKTRAETVANIKEAIRLYLEPDPKSVKPSHKHQILSVAL